jgi:hypothetical protein
MPSTEKLVAILRRLQAAELLGCSDPDLSEAGRKLISQARQWLSGFIQILQHKNGEDQFQELLWNLSRARVSSNVHDLARRIRKSKVKADAAAG